MGPPYIEIFYSYAHEDERYRKKLEKHLSILKKQGLILDWYDRRIVAGQQWSDTISVHINSAHIILLLVSDDFLASDYSWGVELKRAMERQEAGETIVIPIILRPVDWEGAPFGKLQALPKDGKPITSWANRDEAFVNIVEGIRKAIGELQFIVIRGSAQQLPLIERSLLAILNLQKEQCRRDDSAFFTPHLLLALLDIPNGAAQWSLNSLKPDLATEVKRRLEQFAVTSLKKNGEPYSDFQWEDRADVQKAQKLALRDRHKTVTEKQLLLGILETESTTVKGLRSFLGEDDFHKLLQIVQRIAVGPPRPETPGSPFSDMR